MMSLLSLHFENLSEYSVAKSLLAILFKSTTSGFYISRDNPNPVGGASCPAVMVPENVTDFFTGQPKRLEAKISPAFPERMIDTNYYAV